MELNHELFAKRNSCQIFREGLASSSLFCFQPTTHLLKKDPSQGVSFFIKVSDGRKLGKLSAFPQEQEVLLEPGSEFVVTGSVYFNDTWVVNLEQTPSKNFIVPLSDLLDG